MYKLIVTDYDGTLTPNGNAPSTGFFRKISNLSGCGKYFAVSSGRTYSSLKKIFASALFSTVFIANDGSLVMYKNCVLYKCPADKKSVREICSQAIALGAKAFVALREREEQVKSDCFGEDVFKIIIEKNGVNTDSIKEYAKNFTLRVCFEDDTYLEFCNSNANKGTALQAIAKKFSVAKDNIIVFGDGLNDLPMFNVAGKKIAPISACEEVKKVADELCESAQEYILQMK